MLTQNPELELQIKVQEWRKKAREGTLTLEETKEAIKALRAGRAMVAQAAGGSKTSKAKPKPSGDDLLSELESL